MKYQTLHTLFIYLFIFNVYVNTIPWFTKCFYVQKQHLDNIC